jgi:hypothetical protein
MPGPPLASIAVAFGAGLGAGLLRSWKAGHAVISLDECRGVTVLS